MKTHLIKFYLAPILIVPGTSDWLIQYVADLNVLLAKNTDRILVYDPMTGVIPATLPPHDNTHSGPLPSEDFEIWVYVTVGPWQSGYAGIDSSGAGVVTTEWQAVYPSYGQDYQRQIYVLAHEIGHIFMAGVSEYYSQQNIPDFSGKVPNYPLNLLDPQNPFTLTHQDWLKTPMLWNVGGATREEFLAACRYDDTAALTISSNWRSGIPSLETFTVNTTHGRVRMIELFHTVYVYNRDGSLLAFGETDMNGNFTAPAPQHNGYSNAFLIKVYLGIRFSGARWVSVFDLDKMALMRQEIIAHVP